LTRRERVRVERVRRPVEPRGPHRDTSLSFVMLDATTFVFVIYT